VQIYPITLPGGFDTQFQYNKAGIFGGAAEAETLIAVWSWTGPHIKRIDFEVISGV